MQLEDISYLQKLSIVQASLDCGEHTQMFDILNDEAVWAEIKLDPRWMKGVTETNPFIGKDLMNEAEWDVKVKYAFAIYKAVKLILDEEPIPYWIKSKE